MLTLILRDPQRRWHLRDVVRRTGCAIGSVRRELTGLAACGIVTSTRDGNRTYYQAAANCPIGPELRGIVRKTSGMADVLAEALKPLARRIAVAFVYGSQAAGTAGASSDVDLMVVGNVSFARVVAAVGPAQDELTREVNPTVFSPTEFKTKMASGHHFLHAVMKGPKIFIVGDANDLAGLAK
ncbi:MAG: nucleotidyltransferase domain-containing protein [Planctomycetaceae bacterium]|nr:nucleotidyltransferase domain-containing protein [Planctomycetaceae bacterium]